MSEEEAHLLGLHKEPCPVLCAICARDDVINQLVTTLETIKNLSAQVGYDAGDSRIHNAAVSALAVVAEAGFTRRVIADG
jgi:hypothetical protein